MGEVHGLQVQVVVEGGNLNGAVSPRIIFDISLVPFLTLQKKSDLRKYLLMMFNDVISVIHVHWILNKLMPNRTLIEHQNKKNITSDSQGGFSSLDG